MRFLLPVIFLLSSSIGAQEKIDLDEYLDQEVDFSILQEIYDETSEYSDTFIDHTPKGITPKLREVNPPFRAVLPKGAQLTKVESLERFQINETVYVRAQEQFPGSQTSFILSKDGRPLYTTLTKNLTSIERIVNLAPSGDATVVYEAPTKASSSDTEFKLETNLSFHLESIGASLISDLHQANETRMNGNRFQLQVFADTALPFDMGLAMSFFSASLGSQDGLEEFGSVNVNGIFLGPHLKYTFGEKDQSYTELLFKAERSLSFKSTDDFIENSYKGVLFGFGAEWTYKTFLGPFFAGADVKFSRYSLSSTTSPDVLAPAQKMNQTGFGAYIGYRVMVNL